MMQEQPYDLREFQDLSGTGSRIEVKDGLPGIVKPFDFWTSEGLCACCGKRTIITSYTHATGGICSDCINGYLRPTVMARSGRLRMGTNKETKALTYGGEDICLNITQFEGLMRWGYFPNQESFECLAAALSYLHSLHIPHRLCQIWSADFDPTWLKSIHYNVPGKKQRDGTDGWGYSIYLILRWAIKQDRSLASVYAVGIQHGQRETITSTSTFQPWVMEAEGRVNRAEVGAVRSAKIHSFQHIPNIQLTLYKPSDYMVKRLGRAILAYRDGRRVK